MSRSRAREGEGIPVVRDKSLARALVEIEFGEMIRGQLYEAVVEVLRWVEEGAR